MKKLRDGLPVEMMKNRDKNDNDKVSVECKR